MAVIDKYELTDPRKPTIDKDANATLDYSQSWTAWLAKVSDTIATVVVVADEPLLVEDDPDIAAGVVTAYISGGTVGAVHKVTFKITTAGGRKDQRSIYLRIYNR